MLNRILATDNVADIKGADRVVEAVFEDSELKRKVFAEAEPYLSEDALITTNTSAVPLGEMVSAVRRPADFIGLHFFNPVDKTPLLEIVVGEQTSEEALARAFDFAQQGAPGEYRTGRNAGRVPGWTTCATRRDQHEDHPQDPARCGGSRGAAYVETPGSPVQEQMVEQYGRLGRLCGAGFYEYGENGERLGRWPGLIDHYRRADVQIPFEDMKERLLVAAALEAARCIENGVLRTVADANIGSIFGIGYPAWTGGVLQYINQYDGGLPGFVERADELRARYGDRFIVGDQPRSMVATGQTYL